MTYSIVAKDAGTGDLGVAVASRFFAVGALVPHLSSCAAMATQAFINPMWGVEGIRRLTAGEPARTVLADFVKRDRGAPIRQAHMIDATGAIAVHTGAQCIDWAGHLSADGVSVAGNMLAGSSVLDATLQSYLDHGDMPFVERLLTAMEAGEAAGGDKRGRQSAGLRLHRGQDYAHLDLRVDDHGDPLGELRRLYAVAGERYLHFAEIFATRDNFQGITDRTDLDRSIADSEFAAASAGTKSNSQASGPLISR